MPSLPIVVLLLIGCGGPAPVATEGDGQGAARALSRARDLENGRKTKRAMAAYNQIIHHFPDTPEAREAARRIADAQRDAVGRVRARKSN